MADLPALQRFASDQSFDLTKPLNHEDHVGKLAAHWLPEMRFHEDEWFHPISLEEALSMVANLFAQLPETARAAWRVPKLVRTGPTTGVTIPFDPPVVHVPDGVVPQGNLFLPAFKILTDGVSARDALVLPEVDSSAVITHGANVDRSRQFFGSKTTFSGGTGSAPGDPFVPRADEENPAPPPAPARLPHITVMASLKNLLELLKYELLFADFVAELDDPLPDGLRGGFDITEKLLRPIAGQTPPLPPAVVRTFLLALIAAHEAGGTTPEPTPPPGWRVDWGAWRCVTGFAFLEYDFFYAYNDFERYQTALFDNEHEGDSEGCCLVFERNALNVAVSSGDPDALLRVVPFSIIASVHHEWQDADIFKFIASRVLQPGNLARDEVDFTVYIAGGSHATYLTQGTHDLVDFQDSWGWVQENSLILLVLPPDVLLVIAIILAIIEHFVDTEDFTSDNGVHAGPDDVVGEFPTKVKTQLTVMPMSSDNHIYMPDNESLLLLRSFAGKWGGHSGIINFSGATRPQSGRYFRRLLDKLS